MAKDDSAGSRPAMRSAQAVSPAAAHTLAAGEQRLRRAASIKACIAASA
jgi:hypothetical protein